MPPTQQTNGLKNHVHVRNPETQQYEAFGPEDELPTWFKDAASPGVFESTKKTTAGAKSTSSKTPEPPPEPSEPVKDLRKRIAEVDDISALQKELDGETRESAKKALQSRINAVTEAELEAGTHVFATVEEIDDYITGLEDVEKLNSFRAAEEAGPNRKTAVEVFDKAIEAAAVADDD